MTRIRPQRRALIQAAGTTALLAGLPRRAHAQAKTIRIGYVTPTTGPLAPFAEADRFVIEQMRQQFSKGLKLGAADYKVEILVKDSQSNPNRAAEVAGELIRKDKVNLVLVASTPETTNPVSDQCELARMPCISTVAPWQPWFFARGGKPETGFRWTYHFFWGLEDVIEVFTNMWQSVPTNKQVGGLFPNDGDGNAWGDPNLGFPKPLAAKGFQLADPGRYQNMTQDFSAQIAAFKSRNVEILTGVPIPPDFTTFWNQALQKGFKPKIASIGKALLFPASVEALGDKGVGLSTEVWWTPTHPFKSSLTGQSARQLADAFEASTKKQWTQPLGFAHALFEVAVDALGRAQDPTNAAQLRDAIAATDLQTMVGPVKWGGQGPFKNVARTPLVGGQWKKGTGKYKYDLVVVSNQTAPAVPMGGKLDPL